MSTSPRLSFSAARTAVAALAATLSLAACTDPASATSPIDESAITHVQTLSASRLLVADVLEDAADRLLSASPADSPVGVALASLRAAAAGGDQNALTTALTATERAIDDARAIEAAPDADLDAVSLHLLAVRTQLASIRLAK